MNDIPAPPIARPHYPLRHNPMYWAMSVSVLGVGLFFMGWKSAPTAQPIAPPIAQPSVSANTTPPSASFDDARRLGQLVLDDLTQMVSYGDYKADFDAFNAELTRLRQIGVPPAKLDPWYAYRSRMALLGEELLAAHRLVKLNPARRDSAQRAIAAYAQEAHDQFTALSGR